MFEEVAPAYRERTMKWLRWVRVRVRIGEVYAETLDERVWQALGATDRMDPAPDIQHGSPQWAYQQWVHSWHWTTLDDLLARAAADAWVDYWLATHPVAQKAAA